VPTSAKTVIGSGENAVELYPVGGAYAERMVMAYFPGHKLLYGADLVFPNRGPDGKFTQGFFETSAADLRRAVEREKLVVDCVLRAECPVGVIEASPRRYPEEAIGA
jgi:hypothetical protein